jgi:hypothetical protein
MTQQITQSHDIPNLPNGMDAGNMVDCHVRCVVIKKIQTTKSSAIVMISTIECRWRNWK